MEGGGGGGANQIKKLKISSLDHSIFASAASNSFLGSRTMVSFGDVGRVNGSGSSFYQSFDPQETGDEYLDDYFNQPEKKKRLSVEQVQFLERSFEVENKLEPERKSQLANELSLQPRQIAVWFQNRRARSKTKHLETEYETLHANYKSLKMSHDILLKENEKLKAEVFHLKHDGLGGDIDNVDSRPCDTKVADTVCNGEESKVSELASKNDDHNSAKGDVFESYLSELSRNGEDSMSDELLRRAYVLHKIEDAYCQSRGYGFTVEDHPLGFWSY